MFLLHYCLVQEGFLPWIKDCFMTWSNREEGNLRNALHSVPLINQEGTCCFLHEKKNRKGYQRKNPWRQNQKWRHIRSFYCTTTMMTRYTHLINWWSRHTWVVCMGHVCMFKAGIFLISCKVLSIIVLSSVEGSIRSLWFLSLMNNKILENFLFSGT